MLELYHHGSSVCATKVRWAMVIKELEFEAHYIDILKGEQFDPEYIRINPKSVVPSLIHDGNIINESTVIMEYLDLAFPEIKLTPINPLEYVKTWYWTKILDELPHPACGTLTFASSHRHIVKKNLSEEELEEFLASTPDHSVTADWAGFKKQVVKYGLDAPGTADKVRLYDKYLKKMNDDLQEPKWLANNESGLADVSLTPYVNRVAMMGMSDGWEGRLPYLTDWWARIQEVPTFQSAILDWCPEGLTNDLKTFGSQSWSEVQEIIGLNRITFEFVTG